MAPLTDTMCTTIAPARFQMVLDGQGIIEEIDFDSLPSGWRQIPALADGQRIHLKALLDDQAIFPFRVDGNGAVVAAKVQANVVAPYGQVRQKVVVERSATGLRTRPIDVLRLLDLRTPDKLAIWEIAVVTQNGNFWVTIQPNYKGPLGLPYVDLYRGHSSEGFYTGTDLYCPSLQTWPEMANFVAGAVRKLGRQLSYLSVEPEEIFESAPDGLARVKWWNFSRQVGEIVTSTGQRLKLHWSNLQRPNSLLAYALIGELVKVGNIQPTQPHGHPTSYDFEALSCEVVAR